MRKLLFYLLGTLCLAACKKDSAGPGNAEKSHILQGTITESISLEANTTYLLKGRVFVKNNATLQIPEGVRVEAEESTIADSKGALIITKGAKLIVKGTAEHPVVFSSAATNKKPGDWIGIVVQGKAPTNLGSANSQGLPLSPDTEFGGADAEDNSGSLEYLRLEYCGGLNADMEDDWEIDNVSGLCMEAVGSATKMEHVMVKNSLDDAFQFVGGNVNGRYLIAENNGDDDYDFDRGYTGQLQFIIAYKTSASTHAIKANGIESLNDKDASTAQPYTRPVISNLTVIGPDGTDPLTNQSQGIYIRKNTRFNIQNSIIAGYSNGGLMLCPRTKVILMNNDGSEFKYNLVNCDDPARTFTYDTGGNGTTIVADPQVAAFAIETQQSPIEKASVNNNSILNLITELKLKNIYTGPAPDLSFLGGSSAASGADFSDTDFGNFFSRVPFRGAVGPENWAAPGKWASW